MEDTPKYEKPEDRAKQDDFADIEKWKKRQNAETMPVPADNQQASFFASIERLAANPAVDVSKIKEIMDMQEHILDRNAEQAFNAAMTRAQNKIELVVAKSENKQTGSKYANLKTVLLSAKPIYTTEGFSLMFYEGETSKENHKRVCVDIMHEQGHTKQRYGDFAIQTTGIAGKAMMTQIHGEGSAFSYGRRYLTCLIFNIPTGDDDDGNAANTGKVKPINDQQLLDIQTLQKDAKLSDAQFTIRIKKKFKVDKPESLSEAQAIELIKALEVIKNG